MDWRASASLGIAFLGTSAACPLVLRILRSRNVIDVPNQRSSHARCTPRGGGAALLVPLALAAVAGGGPGALVAGLLVSACGMAAIGLIEDARGIPVAPRFALQVVVAIAAAPFVVHRAGLGPWGWAIAGSVGVAWTVGFVNAFNFMDGVNGISATEAIVAGLAYAWLGRGRTPLLVGGGLAVAGASIAFLPWNFPNARMFLGDVGSYLLGAWLAVLAAVALRERVGPVAAIGPVALYLTDSGLTLAGRVLTHKPWREPHRDHAYQRLVRAGWSHEAVTSVVGAATAVCAALGLAAQGRSAGGQAVLALAMAAVLLAYMALGWSATARPSTAST